MTSIERVIVQSEERGRERLHKYRWGDAEIGGEEWATETIEPLSRQILLDRWTGLMEASAQGAYTKLGNRLLDVLSTLAEGVTRRDIGRPDEVVVDGQLTGLDIVMDVDGLIVTIQEWILARAAQVARP